MASQGPPQGMQQGHQQQVVVNDHVTNLRNLVGQLKESFAVSFSAIYFMSNSLEQQNLNRTMAANIQHNSQIDGGQKSNEGKVKNFDKPLEDFLSLCNQVERHLKTISDCVVQQRDSQKYIPFSFASKLEANGPVELAAPNPGPDTFISYNQFMNIVKSQVNFTKGVQDILVDAVTKVGHQEVPQTSQVQQQQQQQPIQPMISNLGSASQ